MCEGGGRGGGGENVIECSATTVEPFLKDTPEIRTLFNKDTLLCPKYAFKFTPEVWTPSLYRTLPQVPKVSGSTVV